MCRCQKLFCNGSNSFGSFYNSGRVVEAVNGNGNFFSYGCYFFYGSFSNFSFGSLLFVTASEERHAEYNSKH